MARPRRQDRDETVQKAMQFFWRKGFAGGSIRELCNAIDLHPGSVYSSFGSKEELYKLTLELFTQRNMAHWREQMDQPRPFFHSLEHYLSEYVSDSDLPKSCLLARTLATEKNSNEDLAHCARTLMERMGSQIRERVERGQKAGEVTDSLSSVQITRMLQVQLLGLGMMADSVQDPEVLGSTVRETVHLLRSQLGTA